MQINWMVSIWWEMLVVKGLIQGNYGSGHIYWRNLWWRTSFFCAVWVWASFWFLEQLFEPVDESSCLSEKRMENNPHCPHHILFLLPWTNSDGFYCLKEIALEINISRACFTFNEFWFLIVTFIFYRVNLKAEVVPIIIHIVTQFTITLQISLLLGRLVHNCCC